MILRTEQLANKIGPSDLYKFKVRHTFHGIHIQKCTCFCPILQEIALIITAVGVTSSLTFYAGARTVRQPLLNNNIQEISDNRR